jgi:hypothetical protein
MKRLSGICHFLAKPLREATSGLRTVLSVQLKTGK